MKLVEDAVRKTMSDQFKSVKVRNITVKDDTDQFGDDVLHIDVVHSAKRLDPRKAADFTGRLRERLLTFNEQKFPVVYFVSSTDWGVWQAAQGKK
jgi:hypothetical protein